MNKESPANWSPSTSIPTLDGVRGLACLLVVYFHAGLAGWVPVVTALGDVGVQLFFTLSGFLMAYHYLPKEHSIRYWLAFYMRRYFRLYPVFFITAIIAYILNKSLGKEVAFEESNLLDILFLVKAQGLFWTILVELKFYAIYPFLSMLFITNTKNRLYNVAIKIFVVFAIIILLANSNNRFERILMFFFNGMLAALLLKNNFLKNLLSGNSWCIVTTIVVAIVSIILFLNPTHLNLEHSNFYNYYWFFSPLLAIGVLSSALSSGAGISLLDNKFIRLFGRISYSMYLTHFFVETYSTSLLHGVFHNLLIMWTLVIQVSIFFYYVIEKPFHTFAVRCARKIMQKEL